ncbi:N alpha-acetyl-transferase [Conoideocrella luteorostrata]|uniref:N-alpha-acetyltransferase 40 n=1 Tax=Conoideocrella luteorostrata TaxID=1105319 RepID=A0AAJ0CL07_9HYPO|nr:N alpha-acetyl-transferase [Conoideocrella luteorostrata]
MQKAEKGELPAQQAAEVRSRRRQPQRRRRAHTDPIERANSKNDADFTADYLPLLPREWTHPHSRQVYTLQLLQSARLTDAQLDSCFGLIDETSGQDYRGSSTGWHPSAKKKEMRSPDLRYILVRHDEDIRGFTSMMPTYENGEAVVYCYEIHLRAELKGTGLGKQLMQCLIQAGDRVDGVEKVMLTCFVSNEHARAFYRRLGFDVDESSPGERKLRGGKVVVPDYVVMSRRTAGGTTV